MESCILLIHPRTRTNFALFLRRLNDNVEIEVKRIPETTTRVWISSNSTTHTHFDESHNVFTQCRGTKKFVLFPPDSCLLATLSRKSSSVSPSTRTGIRTCPHFAVTLFPEINSTFLQFGFIVQQVPIMYRYL